MAKERSVPDICRGESNASSVVTFAAEALAVQSANTGIRQTVDEISDNRSDTVVVKRNRNGDMIVMEGNLLYYCVEKPNGIYLYKKNRVTGHKKIVRKLTSKANSVELAGKYKNKIYYILWEPWENTDGIFSCVDIKTKKIKNLVTKRAISTAEQYKQYFALMDGTGAGYSHLSLWNAKNNKYVLVSTLPYGFYKINSKYIYYVEIIGGNQYRYSQSNVAIKRYTLTTGKKTTLVKSLKMQFGKKLTTKSFVYVDVNGNTRTISW